MSLIDDKRKELEQFLHEQMIGPGGCAGRFGKVGLTAQEEVLNTTPGSVYNTAILFPSKANSAYSDQHRLSEESDEMGINAIDDEKESVDDNDKDSGNSDHDEDFSLERRFPRAMAISCCLGETVDFNHNVSIRITGRYYRKILGQDRRNVFISIPEERREVLASILNKDNYIRELFVLVDGRFEQDLLDLKLKFR